MTFEEYAAEILRIGPEATGAAVDWETIDMLWATLIEKAEQIVSSIAPGASCTAQEWDRRIDCGIKLSDGSFVAEMISLRDLTEDRLRATGDRLGRRVKGEQVQLVNELKPPLWIGRGGRGL
jgi:hypothetical protein